MKLVWTAVMGIVLVAGSVSAAEKALETRKDKVSYIIGYNLGSGMKRDNIEFDIDIVLRGLDDAIKGKKSALTEEEIRTVLTALNQEIMAKKAEEAKESGEKNKKEGAAFLAENAKKEGVKVLPSGLQYKVMTEGSGKSPKATDTVSVNYRGTLINGTEFDSSYKRGQPASFPVNGVIKGWTEALQLMKEGAKWQLFIPSDLAYGEHGPTPVIGSNAVLIFEVELISVQ